MRPIPKLTPSSAFRSSSLMSFGFFVLFCFFAFLPATLSSLFLFPGVAPDGDGDLDSGSRSGTPAADSSEDIISEFADSESCGRSLMSLVSACNFFSRCLSISAGRVHSIDDRVEST
jgi:hypothetical protein